jgi:hypothetical protein
MKENQVRVSGKEYQVKRIRQRESGKSIRQRVSGKENQAKRIR